MKWEKLGLIFEFYKSPFINNFVSHSQSPQAVIFKNFVRIYFSTRKKDETGKYLSHIQFVDYSKDFKKIINYSNHEVIPLGNKGCFDEHGIFPFSPTIYGDKVYAYTSGWTRRVSVDVDSGIGFAISSDCGSSFIKQGDGPILSSSLYEPFLIGDAFVRVFHDKFYMFYIFGEKWLQETTEHLPERVYKIAYAISNDGINWQKMNRKIIGDKIDENECQALPTVIEINGHFHMFFCYRHATDFRKNKDKAYRIGYAHSRDLINWIRDDDNVGINVSKSDWDSDMLCYPHVFPFNGNIYMLYNGNEFGRFGFGLAVLKG